MSDKKQRENKPSFEDFLEYLENYIKTAAFDSDDEDHVMYNSKFKIIHDFEEFIDGFSCKNNIQYVKKYNHLSHVFNTYDLYTREVEWQEK